MRPEELEEGAALLARCFVDEPLHAYLLRDVPPERRRRLIQPLFRASLRVHLPTGVIHAARLDGRLVGVAVRTPPGIYPPRGFRRVAIARVYLPATIGITLRVPRWRRSRLVAHELDRFMPAEPLLYLDWLGVEPGLEGRGIGGLLTDAANALADEHGVGCYFSTFTPAMTSLSEQRGFRVIHEGRPLPDGPVAWVMWRERRVTQ